ncbi:MAG: hypothetical protein NC819_00340 [Candidatus Omnitrophica bacterium]|nr:hypothetical protein [Candidatus Omnitrophota bacterium]
MRAKKDRAEEVVRRYVDGFVKNNRAAALIKAELDRTGIGLMPVVDHITVRTFNVDKSAKEFLRLGFKWDKTQGKNGILEFDDWWAKVFRKPGLPAVFIDQGYAGPRGATSVIPPWVRKFGSKTLHHVAIRVGDIEKAIAALRKKKVKFAGQIVGARGTDLRQIFTAADVRKGYPFTVVEIIERHRGYTGFSPPQADSLMKSSVITNKKR